MKYQILAQYIVLFSGNLIFHEAICMKYQILFSRNGKIKPLICHLNLHTRCKRLRLVQITKIPTSLLTLSTLGKIFSR